MRNRAPLFGVLIAVLLAVAFYFLLYSPKNDELEAVRAETAQLETQRSSLQNELAALREVEANQVEIRAQLARLEEYIPSGPAQSTAVRQFQLSADAAGVEIQSVEFGVPTLVEDAPPTGQEGMALASITVTMGIEGGYFQVVDFLRRVEVDVPRALLMGNLGIDEPEGGFPALLTTWTGNLFAVVPAASVPEPPAEGAQEGAEGAEPTEETGEPGEAGTETEGADS
jgi:Tfp pilus assembly protein PilO